MPARPDDPHDEGAPSQAAPPRANAAVPAEEDVPRREEHGQTLPAQSGRTRVGLGAPHEPETERDPRLGAVLGGLYELEEVIGQGGMGTVYAARHVHLQKRFAIKLLSAEQTPSERAIARLKQEAIAASSIRHDNIVDVVSLDSLPDGSVFIAMELLEGENLASAIARGPLPVPMATVIAVQVARALGAAHERGILHRDLKPENIFLESRGAGAMPRAKVLDFGISKVQSAEAEKVRLTQSGQLVGTPRYMSPEQAKGDDEVDRRADIYALGVILFEMLTGNAPFEAENYFQLLWKHGHEAPPAVSSVSDAELPRALDEVVHRALSKAPDDRFAHMAEFEAGLRSAVHDDSLRALAAAGLGEAGPEVAMKDRASPVHEVPKRAPRSRGGVRGVRLWMLSAMAGFIAVFVVLATLDPTEAPVVPARSPSVPPPVADVEPHTLPNHRSQPHFTRQPQPETAPPQIPVQFDSAPPGAAVFVNGKSLGSTPLVAPVPADAPAVTVVFTLDGFEDYEVRVVVAPGSQVHARMTRTRRRPQRTRLPIKTEF